MNKFRLVISSVFVILSGFAWSQQNLLPLGSYYKDKLFSPLQNTIYNKGSFLPVSEGEYDLHSKIVDSTKQYYEITAYLYKKHLLEFKGEDYYLTISPTMDFSYGRQYEDDGTYTTRYNNTRGFYVEGDLLKNVSFSSSFYENQSRFTDYERAYYVSIGEVYPNGGSQNAVVPGSARTKPFKTDGFDYAFAVGNVVYAVNKKIQISGGNNPHFIGTGYRSLLLSDNGTPSPYIQSKFNISNKWTFIYMRSRLMNLLRRPYTSSDESYYVPKDLSVNYLTYCPTSKLAISFFEGGIWSKGDSVSSTPVNGMYYNPVPILSGMTTSDEQVNILLGINTDYVLTPKHRLYSQLTMTGFNYNDIGFQIGYRGYNFSRLKNMMFQMEYNIVPKSMYHSPVSKLNYSHSNLPIAHPKGSGFQEFVLRLNYEFFRFYIDLKVVAYTLEGFKSGSLMQIDKKAIAQYGSLQHDQFEFGYRFNRKLNLTLFGSYLYRNDLTTNTPITKFFQLGIRTGLITRYTDF